MILDPENFEVFDFFQTEFPVHCSKISSLIYSKTCTRNHLIFGGGIATRDQAMQSEGGNLIYIYNMETRKIIAVLAGSLGRINWLSLFPDGSGLLTAGEEGISRVYRFD